MSEGWWVVTNGSAPARRGEYRGPDQPDQNEGAPPDPDDVPVWMGIASQLPLPQARSSEPWQSREGFRMTSTVLEDSDSAGSFEHFDG